MGVAVGEDIERVDEDGVSLSEAIAVLRAELQDAMEAGDGSRLRFGIDSIELELELAVNATKSADGKLSLWKVLSAGGSLAATSSAKHRMTLVLKPRDTSLDDPGDTLIGDDM